MKFIQELFYQISMRIKKCFHASVLLFLFIFPFCSTILAQYNHEIGITGGGSFYLGDANHSTLFNRLKPAYGGFYKYNIDTRYAIKLQALVAEVEGDSRDFNYVFPDKQYGYFNRKFVDASLTVEFNFFDIGESKYYKSDYNISPYILFGIGLTAYNNIYVADNFYKFNFPMGVGGKWKVNKRWTLGAEWTMHKMYVDDFDVTGNESKILNNPYQTNKTAFFDDDWYSVANLFISYNLIHTKRFCH